MPSVITTKNGSSPLLVAPAMPKDPNLRAVAEDVVAKLHYSFTAAAAEDQPSASGGLDKLFRSFINSRSAAARARCREQAQALLAAPAAIRTREFRRYAAVSAQEYRTLGSDKIDARVGKLDVNKASVKSALTKLNSAVLGKAFKGLKMVDTIDPDLKAGLDFKTMKLFIRNVRCIEETDEVGSDEINIGGNAVDPFGNTILVNEFEVSDDFDEGEQVNFGDSKVFHTWNLVTKQNGFPYVYGAAIALGEKDDGGFYKFLEELWAKVESEVKKAIAGAVGAAIGAAIGAAFAGIGAAIGAIVGAIIGLIIDWLISLFDNEDDIVGVIPVTMTLAAATKSYYDWAKLTTSQGWTTTLAFAGDGGRYEVDIAYRVFK